MVKYKISEESLETYFYQGKKLHEKRPTCYLSAQFIYHKEKCQTNKLWFINIQSITGNILGYNHTKYLINICEVDRVITYSVY